MNTSQKRIRPRSQNDLVRKTTYGRLLKSTSLAHFKKANQTQTTPQKQIEISLFHSF